MYKMRRVQDNLINPPQLDRIFNVLLGTWSTYLANLSMRLVGVVGGRNYVTSSFSQ